MDVVLGVKNIQRNLEPESQWKRVVTCMQKLSNFEITQAWVTLTSSINTQTGDAHSIVLHSQYKMIFERALAEAFPVQVEMCCCDGKGNTDTSVLKKYKEMLDQYHRFLYLAVITMREKNYPGNISTPRPRSAESESSSHVNWPAESTQPETPLPINQSTDIQPTKPYETEDTTTEGMRPLTGDSISSKDTDKPSEEFEHEQNAITEPQNNGTSHVDEESLKAATEHIIKSKIDELQVQIQEAEKALQNMKHPHNRSNVQTRPFIPGKDSPYKQDARDHRIISEIAYMKELEEKISSWNSDLQKLRQR